MPGAHGLPLDPPRPLLVGAVADGALVRLHLPAGWDDGRLCEAVGTWGEEGHAVRAGVNTRRRQLYVMSRSLSCTKDSEEVTSDTQFL